MPDASRLGDAKTQMEFISRVDFEPRRLLQTSLGETIAPSNTSGSEAARGLAFRSINSKRLDFLVIDRSGMPALAVEYQGHGHYQNRAFMRDAVKREAVRKAGVPFLEIPAEYDVTVEENRIRAALRPDQKGGSA